jgi:glycosyltransferase involved in cell wall biosynthesis
MRIVHILQGKANPETLNGVNKVVHWMATYQSRQGHNVEVWGLAVSMKMPPHPREYRLRLFPVTRLRATLGTEIKSALSHLEPGAWVQFHSVFIPEFPSIARWLTRHGFAYGVTPHGGYSPEGLKKNFWRKRLYIALREAGFLRHAAWIHAIGASEVRDISRLAPAVRVVLIPNGQEPVSNRPAAGQVQTERPLFGFCGRLATQHKGLDYLIDGFAAYKAKGGAGQLWFIGDGDDRAELERRAAERGLATHVRFLGPKHGEEKLSLLATFDLFLHTSRWEGLPMSCLEAASLGVPLVVSRETNLAEFVERAAAGLVLDQASPGGVLRALEQVQRLYLDRQLQPMGENARLLVEKEFSWEENARSFVAAIRACHAV